MAFLTDSSGLSHEVVNQTGVVSNATTKKFGFGAADFSQGLPDTNLYSVDSPDWTFDGDPFTVETWALWKSHSGSAFETIMAQWGGGEQLGWWFGANNGNLNFYYSTTGGDFPNVAAAFTPTLDQWYHIAVDRDESDVLRLYVDGDVLISSTVGSNIFSSIRALRIGNDDNLNRRFTGILDEIRISKGVARYGGAFTKPNTPFETDSFTKLLLHFDAVAAAQRRPIVMQCI